MSRKLCIVPMASVLNKCQDSCHQSLCRHLSQMGWRCLWSTLPVHDNLGTVSKDQFMQNHVRKSLCQFPSILWKMIIFRCEDIMFAITLGGIYVFAFFNAKDERTRYKYLIYYTICFVENTIFMVVWALYAEDKLNWRNEEHLWYYYPGIICHYILFFAGLVFMLTYYVTLHPSGTEYSITVSSYQFSNN